jgi:uncharacterized protein (TIGR03437 family)
MRSPLVAILALLPALSAAQSAAPQPVVNAIENNYSFVLPGLPNYGIAQGSIFVIFGANLAPVSSGLQGLPLQTTLDGVSVQFAVGGATTQALLYYVSPNQIGGVLPSATPAGSGQITVTVSGQAGDPAPITVVQSAFGIAVSGSYPANAAVFESERGYWTALTATNAANPGETIEIYGTGGGPSAGNEAGSQIPPQNLTNVPIEVDIGGVPSTVSFHGRSTWPGLDQIDVVIPQGVQGCNVSVVVVSSGLVSNVALIPVAEQGRTCSDQVPGVNLPVPVTVGAKSVDNTGAIFLTRTIQAVPPITGTGGTQPAQNTSVDSGSAMFQRLTQPQPTPFTFGSNGVFPSIGSCTVVTALLPPPSGKSTAPSAPPFTFLNAGPSINFNSPNGVGSAQMMSGFYSGILGGSGTNLPPFFLASGGSVNINNGSGGPDVGAFNSAVNAPPPLVWTNMSALPSVINRFQGVTLTWSGGDPEGLVYVAASSSVVTRAGLLSAQVSCPAPVAAGQFTIPPSALLALPSSSLGGQNSTATSLELQSQDQFPFSAPGLDAGLVYVQFQNILTVPYQ